MVAVVHYPKVTQSILVLNFSLDFLYRRICVMKPRDSWVTRRLVNDRKELYPGMYALEV